MSLLPAAVFLPGSPGQQPVMGGIPNSQFSVPVNVEATFLPLPPPPTSLLCFFWVGCGLAWEVLGFWDRRPLPLENLPGPGAGGQNSDF